MVKPKISFEEAIVFIDQELKKRKPRWTLYGVAWISWEDIEQEIRSHIFQKWHLYDHSQPLLPWLNRIISNQTINSIRNLYNIYRKPCNNCPLSENVEDFCREFGTQDHNKCPVLKRWYYQKKSLHDISLPLALEHHTQEISNMQEDFLDVDKILIELKEQLKKILKPIEYRVFILLYIEHKSEREVEKIIDFSKMYNSIPNIKKRIVDSARVILRDRDIEL